MNIESILEKIDLFEELVIISGLSRDLNDFIQSVQQPQNRNLTFMKELSNKLINSLSIIENSSLSDDLIIVLKDSEPFTKINTVDKLIKLNSNSEIDANGYFSDFNNILNNLSSKIQENNTEINEVKSIFQKYINIEQEYELENKALMSLIFKDKITVEYMKEFSKALHLWDRTLKIYHTLLKSESPEQISLVQIQNGSFDVIFLLDIDVAADLAELARIGLGVFGAYLLYKSETAKEIIKSYMGNKKLIELEIEREKLMLDNIKVSIKRTINEQHKKKIKLDKKIDKVEVPNKVEEVSSVLTDHIIKGNEIKLLTPPLDEDTNEKNRNLVKELRQNTSKVRERLKKIDQEDKIHILKKYSYKDDDNNET